MYREVCHRLERVKEKGEKITFNKVTEIDQYLDTILQAVTLQQYGFKLKDTTIKGKDLRGLLNYLCKKSNGIREYTIVGFMDERVLKKRYGIKQIV